MLREANKTCLRLWRDESGVVLATTIVIFLTLFVMACSVFAVGENIRLRIETQNAADAAAYSAATVQADALSRIAAINRALGWTYAQEVKMEMDFIVDKWLVQSLMAWVKDYIKVRLRAMLSLCSLGPFTGQDDYFAGQSYFKREHLRINKGEWVKAKDILKAHQEASGAGKGFPQLAVKILKTHMNIKGMNKAEVSIVKKMEDRMHRAVKTCLKQNIKNYENDQRSQDRTADIRFAFLNEPKKCFSVMKSEHMFLRSVFGRGTSAKALFGEGTDSWFVQNGNEIGRHYKQLGSKLVADWSYYGNTWVIIPAPPGCAPTIPTTGHSSFKGEQAKVKAFFETAVPEPQVLTADYFAKPGAVVVGVARRLHNPFQYMFPRKKPDGIYGLYSVPMGTKSDSRYIWSVASTRAGYRDHGRSEGSYNPTVDSFEQEYDPMVPPAEAPAWWRKNHAWVGLSPHNLTEPDWDAVFIPLHRAWSQRKPGWQNRGPAAGVGAPPVAGRWEQATAADILSKLWNSAKWEDLYRKKNGQGLRHFADGHGPSGMEGDANFDAMEKHVYH